DDVGRLNLPTFFDAVEHLQRPTRLSAQVSIVVQPYSNVGERHHACLAGRALLRDTVAAVGRAKASIAKSSNVLADAWVEFVRVQVFHGVSGVVAISFRMSGVSTTQRMVPPMS